MALDSQSNWNVEMPQLRISQCAPSPLTDACFEIPLRPPTREISLPVEVISLILSHISRPAQHTLWASTLVSRRWYTASVALLYSEPHLHGGNFHLFAATICPSKNARIRRSTLSPLVRRLDMGSLVHNASKSLTARLLGRLKPNLEEFVAPQASFAINSFAALSKCVSLRILDLSLISASVSNKQLFQTLAPLTNLETLFFPRSSGDCETLRTEVPYSWPPRLKALHLAGGVDDNLLQTHFVNLPLSVTRLSIQHCSHIYASPLLEMLEHIGPQLTHFTLRHPMTKLPRSVLDVALQLCPSLIAFRISADYITNDLFADVPESHPLQILDLDCSVQAGPDVEIDAGVICAVLETGLLADLRSVRVHARLAWDATPTTRQNAGRIVRLLERAELDRPLGIEPGVRIMKDRY